MSPQLEVRGRDFAARAALAAPIVPIDPAPGAPDVSRLPGASVVAVASHEADGVRVVLGCVRAPSSKWVPGLESVVFERATPMILAVASMRPSLQRDAASTVRGASFVEAHRGREGERAVVVEHAIAFVGADADAVACSLACSAAGAGEVCDAAARSLVFEGQLVPEPPPGLFARAVLGAAEHPVSALAVGAAIASAAVTLLLWSRPRFRPTKRAATSSSARARPR